jgi:hypothetical protein
MEKLIAFDLTVIAVCSVLITVGLIAVLIVVYRILGKLEEGVDTVNSQLRPAVIDLKKTIVSITENLKVVSGALSFVGKFKKSKK